jgi:hypothetical protein
MMVEAQLVHSVPFDAVPTSDALRQSRLMRDINNKMRELADSFAYSDLIMFFCECRSSSCYSAIPMSAATFDMFVAGREGWLLREDHQPSALWSTVTVTREVCYA